MRFPSAVSCAPTPPVELSAVLNVLMTDPEDSTCFVAGFLCVQISKYYFVVSDEACESATLLAEGSRFPGS